MECKFCYADNVNYSGVCELIDTLWNVNVQNVNVSEYCIDELIDTLWNVNLHKTQT